MKKKSKDHMIELSDFLNLCTPSIKEQYSKIEINLDEKGPVIRATKTPLIDRIQGTGYLHQALLRYKK